MGQLPVPILSNDQLRTRAVRFLQEHAPTGIIPVPVEEIIDLNIGIDIVPTPGLHQGHDVDAFITGDLTTIYVDEFVYRSRPGRYRFSLAHEIAHLILHVEVYRRLHFRDIAEWKTALQRIEREDYDWLEYQANAFAGLVLVP